MTIGYVFDDGGREAAGFKGRAGDCVTRAVAILTGTDYRQVYNDAAKVYERVFGVRTARNGVPFSAKNTELADQYGLVRVKLPKGPKPTYSEAYERYGDCIVRTRKHVAAIVDGKLRDTFDGTTYYWPANPDDFDSVADCYEAADFIDEDGQPYELRERKALSVYVKAAV